MSFYLKYDLERMITDGPVKTFRAVEKSTGRPVLLHLFSPEGLASRSAMLGKLRDTSGGLLRPLLETGEFSGSSYAVTEVIVPFTSFREWVEVISRAPRPVLAEVKPPEVKATPVAPAAAQQPAPPAETEPGEFTRIFGPMPDLLTKGKTAPPERPAANEPSGVMVGHEFPFETPITPPDKPRAAFSPKPADAHASSGPVKEAKVRTDELPAWPTPNAAAPKLVDDFQRLTGKPGSSKASPQNAWPDKQNGALFEESTLFESKLVGESIDIESEQASGKRSRQPENRPFQSIGEFTRMFGPQSGSKTPLPPPEVHSNASASGLFDSPGSQQGSSNEPGDARKRVVADDYAAATGASKDSKSTPAGTPAAPAVLDSKQAAIPPLRQDKTVMILGTVVGVLAVTTLMLIFVHC